MLCKTFAVCVIAIVLSASSQVQAVPSFDCSKASLADEKAICASEELSAIDVAINDGYKRLVAKLGRTVANNLHATFMRQRHACKADAACISQVGAAEMPMFTLADPTFQAPADLKAPSPAPYDTIKSQLKIGECTLSTVTELGPRLCSADASGNCPENLPFDDSGNSIVSANGFYGVSYDRIPALEKSTKGDVVLICLKSIPKDCPAGDDRGYFWRWKNLRTSGKWELPDSQHMCGGA